MNTFIKVKTQHVEDALNSEGDRSLIAVLINKDLKREYDRIETVAANEKDVEIQQLKDTIKDLQKDDETHRQDYDELREEFLSQETLIESFREGEDTYIASVEAAEKVAEFYKSIINGFIKVVNK